MNHYKSIENMSFEEALAELEEIVRKIDTGQQDLSTAVTSFERGMLLKKHCVAMLNQAKMKIEQIVATNDDEVKVTKVVLD